jgi:hypothetical protein
MPPFFIHYPFLHLFSFKTPASWAVMSEECAANCASSMRNGVNKRHPIHFSFLQNISSTLDFRSRMIRWILFFVLFFIIVFLLFWWISGETDDDRPDTRTLDQDGYIVIRESSKETVLSKIPDTSLSDDGKPSTDHPRTSTLLRSTGVLANYVFLQYKYIIRGCSLSTFHRDVTSSSYIYNTKHPVYTYIEYNNKTNEPLLTVCPGSHKSTPFLYSSPLTIWGQGRTGILFHCDLVHAGAINRLGDLRYAEQYKIAHKDDLPTLVHLQNIHMEKDGKCDISPLYEYISRRISWIFSHIANHHFTSYLQTRPDTHIGKMLLSLYGREFYNGGTKVPPNLLGGTKGSP